MINSIIEKENLNEIADAVIEKIAEINDPFETVTIVFHNTRVQQWFKSYFLKHYNSVLMNVEYKTLSSYINDVLIADQEIRIINRIDLRAYLIRVMSEIKFENVDRDSQLNYIFSNGKLNGIKLYDFANKLSSILINMEYDDEEITGWEKELYKKALECAANDDCFSPKTVFETKFQNTRKESPVYIIDNSYISGLYKKILKEQNCNITIYSVSDEVPVKSADFKVYSAPSILREVEILHSDILKKVQEDKDVRFNDFVVYAPSINDYATSIRRVFRQNGQEYPDVPFVISGENKEKKEMINSLYLLYKIANKGYFTRKDLYQYLKNTMIMKIKELTDDDVDSFMDAVIKTNIHRNNDNCEEWEYLKKRLLTSFLVESVSDLKNTVTLSGEKYLPFASISLDKTSINKLIDIIDNLLSWVALFKGDIREIVFDFEKIKAAEIGLDSLFSYRDEDEKEKNYLYFDVKNEIERIKKTTPDILAITFLRLLLDAPKHSTVSPANVFSGGVTFLNLDCDNIVPEKYIYVLGMSSKNFPRIETKSEIDFSKKHIMTHALDKKAISNILNFPYKKTISFVNCDLKSGEEFFLSSLIPADVITKVSIDETRSYNELFTKRELINKAYFQNIGTEEKSKPSLIVDEEPEFVITTNEIKQYLENTFVYKYKKILKDSKEDEEIFDKEYETIDMNALSQYSLINELILNNEEGIKKKFLLQKKLPYNTEDEYFSYFSDCAEITRKIINDEYSELEQMKKSLEVNGKSITLEINSNVFYKFTGNDLYLIEPKNYNKKELKNKDYLGLYVCSLVIAAFNESHDNVNVHLVPIEELGFEKKFNISKNNALFIINGILGAMSDLKNIKYMDIEYLEEFKNDQSKIPVSIKMLNEKITDKKYGHYSIKFFKDIAMFDSDFGYGYTENICEEMKHEFEKIVQFILF